MEFDILREPRYHHYHAVGYTGQNVKVAIFFKRRKNFPSSLSRGKNFLLYPLVIGSLVIGNLEFLMAYYLLIVMDNTLWHLAKLCSGQMGCPENREG